MKEDRGEILEFVVPGLASGIHVLPAKKVLDGRDKPGHDFEQVTRTSSQWRDWRPWPIRRRRSWDRRPARA
ncbi:MAG: hypothetical protein GEU95_22250 [Rhizobiales bacterium]|nr:hypothetical protein [Hyphomicrobiales bacterium]